MLEVTFWRRIDILAEFHFLSYDEAPLLHIADEVTHLESVCLNMDL